MANDLSKMYNEGKNKLWQAANELKGIKEDRWLDPETKKNRQALITEKLEKEINDLTGEIVVNAVESYGEEYNFFEKMLRGNKKKVEEAAAIKGNQYAQMTDDELVRLLESNFADGAERGLILRYLDSRIEAKAKPKPAGGGLEHVPDPLKGKVNTVINRNLNKLSGPMSIYLQNLNEAERLRNFAENASNALGLEVKKLKGEIGPTDPNIIKLHDAKAAADSYISGDN